MELVQKSLDSVSFDEHTKFFIKIHYLTGLYNIITMNPLDFNRLLRAERFWRNLMDETVEKTLRQTGLRATMRNAAIFVSEDIKLGHYVGENI